LVLSFIETWPAVVKASVRCYETKRADCKHALCFQFRWDRPARIVEARIEYPEEIALWFPADASLDSVPQVRSDRDHFPLDLPHLNCISSGDPASLCLARESLSAIYARLGIRGVLERLNTWLRDAAAGALEHDGWEPTPRLRELSATLDISVFQQFALGSKRDKAGIAQGFALAILDEDKHHEKQIHFQLIAKAKQIDDLWDKSQLNAVTTSRQRYVVPARWFSVWGPRNQPVTQRFWETVDDRDSLLRYAEVAGCKSLVERVLFHNLKRSDAGGVSAFVLLVGTWRPKPLIKSIPGLAEGAAASLELVGFSIWLKKEGVGHQVDSISEIRLLAEANSRNLNRFAGYSVQPGNTVLIGAGALGSKLAEHFVREGAPELKIVDHDRLAPHNLARHSLTADSVHFPKATELQTRLVTINPHCQVEAFRKNFARVPAGSLKKDICGSTKGVIVDATADISVMRRLCDADNVMRVAKIELAHGGLLGLLYYEGKGRRPRIDDLKALVPTLGKEAREEVPEIAAWLTSHEDFRLDTGIGCASASMRMSDSRVALHAANFMASLGKIIRLEDHPSGIGVAVLDNNGHFKSWHWFPEEAPEVLVGKTGNASWNVRIRKVVLTTIDGERDATTPIETGGYLYGTYDLKLRTIYVTAAFAVPAREASVSRVRLSSAGGSGQELELRKFSGEQVGLLGTWHTHPSGSSRPSSIDIEQFGKDAKTYAKTPAPHLMLIRSDTGLSLALAIPDVWQGDGD
jgi:molybdopterin/thiamine biosynthesis adenylyltransferase/proteasome lid subunit RPN8/RPN11